MLLFTEVWSLKCLWLAELYRCVTIYNTFKYNQRLSIYVLITIMLTITLSNIIMLFIVGFKVAPLVELIDEVDEELERHRLGIGTKWWDNALSNDNDLYDVDVNCHDDIGGTSATEGGHPFDMGGSAFDIGGPSFEVGGPSFEHGGPSFEHGGPSSYVGPSFEIGGPS